MKNIVMIYRYCSICGSELKRQKGGYLVCVKCTFVNYRNPRPTVTALVLHQNKLLLTRRARPPYKRWWDLPGGFVDRNELPKEAILRELKEETGLEIRIKEFFGIYSGTYFSPSDSYHILSIVYIAEGSDVSLQAFDDVCESRWFSKDELPSRIAFDSNKKIIKDFLKIWK